MARPTVIITGEAAWADVVAQRAARHYRLVRYAERQSYVARLADDRAALVLVDGDEANWTFWVTSPKVNAATRRIPVVFVSADPSRREQAVLAGADAALTPGELVEQLPVLLGETARVVEPETHAEMARQCEDPLPPEGREAVERFNRGEYYKQHDLFEALWMAEEGPVRDLYRAVLQVGIAYYQITRGNQRGALKMLLRSVQWLALLPDVCQGIDVAQLKADAGRVRVELERVGPEGIDDFDLSLLRPVRLVEGTE